MQDDDRHARRREACKKTMAMCIGDEVQEDDNQREDYNPAERTEHSAQLLTTQIELKRKTVHQDRDPALRLRSPAFKHIAANQML